MNEVLKIGRYEIHGKTSGCLLNGTDEKGDHVIIFEINVEGYATCDILQHHSQLQGEYPNDGSYRQFIQEFDDYLEMCKQADNPHLPKVIEKIEKYPYVFIVTEVLYENFESVINYATRGGEISLEEFLRALYSIHKDGLIARFISPYNVYITETERIIFGFGPINTIDPMYTLGVINRANVKSDVYQLAYALMSTYDDIKPDFMNMTLGEATNGIDYPWPFFRHMSYPTGDIDDPLNMYQKILHRMACIFPQARPSTEDIPELINSLKLVEEAKISSPTPEDVYNEIVYVIHYFIGKYPKVFPKEDYTYFRSLIDKGKPYKITLGRAVNLPYIDLVEKISKKGDKEAIPVFMSYPLLPEYIENYIIMNGYLQDVKMSEKIPKKSKQG